MLQGQATAVQNNIPDDGSVEITVVQFYGSIGQLEVPPTVVTPATKPTIVGLINAIGYNPGSSTPMGAGFSVLKTALLTGDQLRIEPGNIVFQTIGSDMIDRPMIDADVEVVSPVYGSTYLRNNNPSGAVYNNVNIELVGIEASFIALSSLTFR